MINDQKQSNPTRKKYVNQADTARDEFLDKLKNMSLQDLI